MIIHAIIVNLFNIRNLSMKYWAILNKERKGPFTFEEIISLGIQPNTYVWRKGLSDWTKAEAIDELIPLFNEQPEVEDEVENINEGEPIVEILDEETETIAETDVESQQDEIQNNDSQTVATEPTSQATPPDPKPSMPVPPTQPTQQPEQVSTPQPQGQSAPMPATWLWLSVLTTCCCCNPLGLVACWFSARIEDLHADGKYEEAKKSSRNALWWNIITIAFSLLITITII